MSEDQDQLEKAFESARQRIRQGVIHREDAISKSIVAEKEQANSEILSGLISAEKNIPKTINAGDRQTIESNLSGAAQKFRGDDEKVKTEVLLELRPWILAVAKARTAAYIAGGVGIVGLSCLLEKHAWLMNTGVLNNGIIIPLDNGREILAWDQNRNGIMDHQETFNTLTGNVDVAPHAMSNIHDGIPDVAHAMSNEAGNIADHVGNTLSVVGNDVEDAVEVVGHVAETAGTDITDGVVEVLTWLSNFF
jgi:hypothetical protein